MFWFEKQNMYKTYNWLYHIVASTNKYTISFLYTDTYYKMY